MCGFYHIPPQIRFEIELNCFLFNFMLVSVFVRVLSSLISPKTNWRGCITNEIVLFTEFQTCKTIVGVTGVVLDEKLFTFLGMKVQAICHPVTTVR